MITAKTAPSAAVANIKVLSPNLQEVILQKASDRYRVIILLMLDGGMRVSEAVSLRIGQINTFTRTVVVKSLKKRKKNDVREIPMTDRLIAAIVTYFPKLKNRGKNDFLFPTNSKTGHLSRKRVWARLKKYSDGLVNPHMLRHTFASRIVNEGDDFQALRNAQKLLGHQSIQTTQIYTHVSQEQIIQAIQSIQQRKNLLERWREKLFPTYHVHIIPVERGLTKYHVGRKVELLKLAELGHKKVNTVIFGPQGIGKTHLLDNYNLNPDFTIRIDEMSGLKKLFAGLLVEILHRHPDRAGLLQNNKLTILDEDGTPMDEEKVGNIIMRQSVKFIIEDLIAITTKSEYTLIIDDLTRVTPSAVSALEKLKNHFHLLCAARKIDIKKASFLSNFERIDLKPLTRTEGVELIAKMSKHLLTRIGDWEAYKNHIWENTDGNPLFIYEMVERYEKESDLSEAIIKDIQHTAGRKEVAILPFLVGLIACFSVLRYAGRITGFTTDNGAWYFLSAIGVIFLFFGQRLVQGTKRRHV